MRISLDESIHQLQNGQVVGIPTETVYGLAASIHHQKAIQEIFRLKGRPSNNPLIIHVSHIKDVFSFVQETIPDLDLLARDFWPGPMTLVLPIKTNLIPNIVRADLPTAAFRIPSHAMTLKVLSSTGPLVMPSANLSGRPSSTQAAHVENDFGRDFPVLDGGSCNQGLESTILIYNHHQWEIIRQGAIIADRFESTLGYKPLIQDSASDKPLCPGQMYKHYAPLAKLIPVYSFENITKGVVIGFSDRSYPKGCHLISLGNLSNPEEIAANFYHALRLLDQEGHSEAMVDMNFPNIGLFNTLQQRFSKILHSVNH